MVRWLVVFALLLVGCHGNFGSDYRVTCDSTFSIDQATSIARALRDWEDQTASSSRPLHFTMEISDAPCTEIPGRFCVHKATRAQMTEEDSAPNAVNAWGLTTRNNWVDSAVTNLYESVPPEYFERVTEHEIGHAMALVHTGPGTIMCVSATCDPEVVTPADVEQYLSFR